MAKRLAKRLLALLGGERRGWQAGPVDQIWLRFLIPAETDVFRFTHGLAGDDQLVLVHVRAGREPFTIRPLQFEVAERFFVAGL